MEFTEPVLLELESQRRSATAVAKRDRVMELLQPAPGEHILDIGCGGGAFCRQIAPLIAPGGSVVGIDNVRRRSMSLCASLPWKTDPC